MGTNYYWKFKVCAECKRGETIHIGKQSAGWPFLFRAHEEGPNDFVGWLGKLTGNGEIRDEYERKISFETFIVLVIQSRIESQKLHDDAFYSAGFQFVAREFS